MVTKKPSKNKATKKLTKKLSRSLKKGKLRSGLKAQLRSIQAKKAEKKQAKRDQIEADWLQNREHINQEQEEDILDGIVQEELAEAAVPACESPPPSKKLRKQNKIKEEIDEEEDKDDKVRSFAYLADENPEYRPGADRLKYLLPVKTAAGHVISRFGEASAHHLDTLIEQSDQKLRELEEGQKGVDPTAARQHLTPAQLMAERGKLLREMRGKVASLSNSILQSPEEQTGKLRELLSLANGEADPLIQSTAQKLAMASLAEVLLDLIPGYRIRERSDNEMAEKLKKETRALFDFEDTLLRTYKKFLQLLESFTANLTKKPHKMKIEIDALTEWSVKTLCRFLCTHYHFNYRSNILLVLVPLCSCKSDSVRSQCCEALKCVFSTDKLGEASLDGVRCVAKYTKENMTLTSPDMLDTLLCLKIKEVVRPEELEEKQKMLKRKEHLQKVSKKERKYQKQLHKLEHELREAEAEESKQKKVKLHTQIMNHVFATYFRVLRRAPESLLLAPVLEGLSKFAHLINVDFFQDLLSTMQELIVQQRLKPLESLHCIHCAFTILSGEGMSLNIDPYRFYVAIYRILPTIVTEPKLELQLKQIRLCLQCLHMMLNDRKKQVSLGRVAAFAKRLSLLSLIAPRPFDVAIAFAVRTLFLNFAKLETLVDSEVGGSGKYFAEMDDPEHCNALSSILTEIVYWKDSNSAVLKALYDNIENGLPSQGVGRLLPALAQKNAIDFIDEFDMSKFDSTATVLKTFKLSKKARHQRDGLVCHEIEQFVRKSLKAKV